MADESKDAVNKNKKDQSKVAGGKARAAALDGEERKAIAKKGAMARWEKAEKAKPLQATHRGNFRDDFGIDVECYVLNDEQKTAVLSRRGMAESLGIKSTSGMALPRFLSRPVIAKALGRELLETINKPLIFKGLPQGPKSPPVDVVHGYDAAILIDICKALTTAANQGESIPPNTLTQANIVLAASAKAGIKGLVYALAGYRPEVEEVIHAFKVYVREEAKKYEQEFPQELYLAWQRLYKIPLPVRGKPWQFMHLTRKHIYYPLAKSNGKLLDLLRALRSKNAEQKRYLFQFLNEIGARALRMQIGRVLEMAESSADDERAYEAKIVERFGGQQELDFAVPSPNAEPVKTK